jgi:hypothetical protein
MCGEVEKMGLRKWSLPISGFYPSIEVEGLTEEGGKSLHFPTTCGLGEMHQHMS